MRNLSDNTAGRPGLRRFLAVGAFALLAAIVLHSSVAATSSKPYTASVAPATVAGGSTSQMTFTIVNGANTQTIGSLNLGAPSGFSNSNYVASKGRVDSTSSTLIRLRDIGLAPGASMTVTMTTAVPCAAGPYTWSVKVKQSNDFNGPPGNDFTGNQPTTTVAGGCKLDWGNEPASAVKQTTITSAPYDTGGASVTVRAVDGDGNTLTTVNGLSVTLNLVGSLAGCPSSTGFANTTATLTDGVATFDALTATNAAYDCKLVGSATGYTSTPASDPFSIAIDAATCSGSTGCELNGLFIDPKTQVDASTSNGSFQFLAIGPQTIPASVIGDGGGCANFEPIGAAVFDAADGGGTGTKTFRYFVDKSLIPKQYQSTSGQQFLPICAGGAKVVAGEITKCTDADDPTGWIGKVLDNQGKFTPAFTAAKCDPDTGLWWGILPSFQDVNSGQVPSDNPIVAGWGSSTNARYFDISVPSPWDWRAGS